MRRLTLIVCFLAGTASGQTAIDTVRPDAPEMAAQGPFATGVRTVEFVHEDRIDVTAIERDAPVPDPLPRADRRLVVEIWYPAEESDGDRMLDAYLRDGETVVELTGRAVRDAPPLAEAGPFPLVIVSHGYPGNRFLMSHLADNLATKGYVVASIDHQDSTYGDQAAFGSTLVHRPVDQLFVLEEIARMGSGPGFLDGLVEAEQVAIVGYSMGGYGAVIAAGGGVAQAGVDLSFGAPHGLLGVHLAGSESHAALLDPRVKTVIAIGPWGRARGMWDAEGMAGLSVPALFIAGSVDDVSGYEEGVRLMWDEATGVDRALLTFEHANHNAAAPYPAPPESYAFNEDLGFAPFEHYADPVWDTVRMNNVTQHFVTVWLDTYLKGRAEAVGYLDLVPVAADGLWSVDEDGSPTEEHTYWRGFANRTAAGLRFEWLRAE
ncbi:alpha/beta hydrolase family protein [Aestuariibius sp. 2305UL40-4]|uniref:alpha/beta hydrolase family protein n=1 Tax=Aestuariibius violaceus TaxID=3234132 RepID=UPI00345E2C23